MFDEINSSSSCLIWLKRIKSSIKVFEDTTPDGEVLRRAVSNKGLSISALQKLKDNLFESCKRYPEQLSMEVYRQFDLFAGYSFCKVYSAPYAVESY